jgi:hypothetical protein
VIFRTRECWFRSRTWPKSCSWWTFRMICWNKQVFDT